MQNLTGRLARGSMWISASRGIVNLLGFLSTLVMARLLLPDDFGLVALGMTMFLIVQSITDLSLAQALVHHKDPTEAHFHTAWTLNTLRGAVLGGAFAAAGPLAGRFFDDPRMASVMYAFGAALFLAGLANPRRIMLQKQLIFWQDFMLQVSQKLIGVIVGVVVAIIFRSYWALIASIVAGQIAQVLISYTVLPFRPRPTLKYARDLWSFSVWLTLSQMINTINWRIDQLLIGKFLGRTDLGYYTMGNNLAVMPTRETTLPLTQTLFPAFSQLRGDPERLRRAYQRAQALVTAIALPLGVGMALVAEPLVLVAMGEKWLPATAVIQAMAVIIAIQTIGSQVAPLGMSLGATRTLFVRDTQLFCIRLPMIIAGMYLDGLQGVIWARVLAGLISTGVNLLMVRKLIELRVTEQLAANMRCIIAVVAMGAAVWAVGHAFSSSHELQHLIVQIVASVCVGAAAYIVTSFGLWLVAGKPSGPESEIMSMAGKLRGRLKSA